MAEKKFLVSVADAYGYDVVTDDLLFVGKTLLDSSFKLKLANTDIKGGKGAQLQYIYFHTPDLAVDVNDTQWNLEFLALNSGKLVVTGNDVYQEENVTLAGGGAGTVAGTPLSDLGGATIYGWVTLVDGTVEKVTFSGSNFTCSGSSADVVCVRYYALNSASTSVTIPANIVPSIFKLVLEAQLVSSDETSNVIGKVQIVIPRATATGSFELTLKTDGVSTTPLMTRALASPDLTAEGCSQTPIYAKMVEILDNVNWYDDVIGLSVAGGDFGITALTSPKTLSVWAIPGTPGKAAFKPPVADLTFISGTPTNMTAGLNTGVITRLLNGTSLITVSITAKPAITIEVTGTAT
jgi:hypothetical protein